MGIENEKNSKNLAAEIADLKNLKIEIAKNLETPENSEKMIAQKNPEKTEIAKIEKQNPEKILAEIDEKKISPSQKIPENFSENETEQILADAEKFEFENGDVDFSTAYFS